jgi:hypothetical protein
MRLPFSIFLFCFSICSSACFGQTTPHEFYAGRVHVLLPNELREATYPRLTPDESQPDVYYIAKDTVVEFTMGQLPTKVNDLNQVAKVLEMAYQANGFKIVKSRVETINGKPVLVTEMEGQSRGKETYNLSFVFNLNDATIMGGFSVLQPLRDKWKKVGYDILQSINYQ